MADLTPVSTTPLAHERMRETSPDPSRWEKNILSPISETSPDPSRWEKNILSPISYFPRFPQKSSLNLAKKQGIEQGVKQGIEQNKKVVVMKSFKAGLDRQLIQKITGLNEDQVEDILNHRGES